jgi:hypothetical protein
MGYEGKAGGMTQRTQSCQTRIFDRINGINRIPGCRGGGMAVAGPPGGKKAEDSQVIPQSGMRYIAAGVTGFGGSEGGS